MYIEHTRTDKIILVLIYFLLFVTVLIVLFPLIYVLIGSFMDPTALINKGISFNIRDYSFEGYKRILSDNAMLRGFLNSLFYSVSFSIVTVVVSISAGYSLSINNLVGYKFFMVFFTLTMFFGGGLIPTYLLVKDLGMLNTPWAIIIPGAVNVWNIILARTFFKSLPKELMEAAEIDGASELRIFFNIVLPLSKPIIFVLALYAFVGQWNSFFDAMIYLQDPKLYPLQLVLRSLLIQNQIRPEMILDQQVMAELARIGELIKYASIVVSSVPLLVMYPFFEKYFEKGVLVGSLK
ncbi:carbohydrate ABC transporter permease [Thermoanaerobacterium thermosaccharolyticum]|jgi:putative aldouronate transport system permease protein|uniref:carbohydrate ABC transporter permease n=1 Tax=Thermoanaerobacterium thermosaccharolyticum TaxID=1517 RepID=UPI0017874390|nr:carbohydrate ABC transporter permease [Thermoanaerobacterium thermosaccharolyticum]MBE0069644.1 carbohydrate ABC transporter permease [Thermoanaerobacterium thermosaccharolyticum]MBE0229343.1 carbohydrate ABC transporter permease [Thermoanaerobacterium thermosaccharolyticum]